MEPLPNFADAIRKTAEAYTEALSTVAKALPTLPAQDNEARRGQVDQWLRLARMSKDGVVTALDQGFELWERECRRLMGAPHAAGSAAQPANPMEAWAENWRKALEVFGAAGRPGDLWSDQARKQAELVQQTLQEGVRAWQRFWQPPGRQ